MRKKYTFETDDKNKRKLNMNFEEPKNELTREKVMKE